MLKAKIYVHLKASVLDPQGKAVTQSLHQLGYQSVVDTRVSKYLEIVLDENDETKASEQVIAFCRKLLANPNTETFSFEFVAMESQS